MKIKLLHKKDIIPIMSYGCFGGMVAAMAYGNHVLVTLFFIVGYLASAIGSKKR